MAATRPALPGGPGSRRSVRVLLLALVVACLVPGVVGAGLLLHYQYAGLRAQVESDTLQTVRALVQAVDSQLLKSRVAAQALATSGHLADGDLAAFHRQARQLLEQAQVGANVVLSDGDGRQLVNTLREFGEPLPRHGNPEQLARVFATGQPLLSDVYVGGVARRPVMSIDVPVRAGGRIVYDLSVGVFPEQLSQLLRDQRLPADWVAGIYDRKGTIAGRTHAPEQFVGQKASPALLRAMAATAEGTLDSVTREGTRVVAVYSRSSQSGWTVAIGIPKGQLEAGWVRAVSQLGLGIAVVFGVALVLAWRMGSRIADAVRALIAPARALGAGEPVATPPLGVREAAEVADALTDAAGLLAERTQALHQAVDAVRELNAGLEQRVEQRTAELLAANRELDAFAYSVSHDLRAPLRAMTGFSQALLEDCGERLDDQARDYLQEIAIAGRRMGELIEGLLALSRNTRGELQRDTVDLSALATRLLGELAAQEPARAVTWQVEPGLAAVGDARMLEVVLRNLLANAWKYTGRTAAPLIRVHAGAMDGRPAVCVADNGAGFAMEQAGRLFQPFQRLHRQDEFPGIGIGLATVQRIVRRHGGDLRASGAPGAGATFCFTLAADPPQRAPATAGG